MIDSYLFCIYWKDYHVIWRIYIELIHRYENIDEICSSTHTILDVLTIYVVAGVRRQNQACKKYIVLHKWGVLLLKIITLIK